MQRGEFGDKAAVAPFGSSGVEVPITGLSFSAIVAYFIVAWWPSSSHGGRNTGA